MRNRQGLRRNILQSRVFLASLLPLWPRLLVILLPSCKSTQIKTRRNEGDYNTHTYIYKSSNSYFALPARSKKFTEALLLPPLVHLIYCIFHLAKRGKCENTNFRLPFGKYVNGISRQHVACSARCCRAIDSIIISHRCHVQLKLTMHFGLSREPV